MKRGTVTFIYEGRSHIRLDRPKFISLLDDGVLLDVQRVRLDTADVRGGLIIQSVETIWSMQGDSWNCN